MKDDLNLRCDFRDDKKQTELEEYLQALFAERTRVELVVGVLLRQFSKLLVSATHPPFQANTELFRFASAKIDTFLETAKFFDKNFHFFFRTTKNNNQNPHIYTNIL